METKTPAKLMKLIKLSDSQLVFADPAEDVRGRKVWDAAHAEIGHVDGLLIDDQTSKVRFIRVASRGFLGLGQSTFLLPVDAIKSIDGEHVHIDRTREHVAGAPPYDPELENDSYYDTVSNYYGYAPFWGMGYMYPTYPYYPMIALRNDKEIENANQTGSGG